MTSSSASSIVGNGRADLQQLATLSRTPTGSSRDSALDEIADGIYRISTWIPEVASPAGFTFNQFLVLADEPLLFHTGPRAMFSMVSTAVGRLVPVERLRWITFGHVVALRGPVDPRRPRPRGNHRRHRRAGDGRGGDVPRHRPGAGHHRHLEPLGRPRADDAGADARLVLQRRHAAETFARKLPKALESPIVVERHNRVDWEHLTEVDERP